MNIYSDLRDTGDAMPEELKNRPLNDKLDYLPYKKQYEIASENLENKSILGSGNFGVVRKGILKMASPKNEEEKKMRLTVAVKCEFLFKNCIRNKIIQRRPIATTFLKQACLPQSFD